MIPSPCKFIVEITPRRSPPQLGMSQGVGSYSPAFDNDWISEDDDNLINAVDEDITSLDNSFASSYDADLGDSPDLASQPHTPVKPTSLRTPAASSPDHNQPPRSHSPQHFQRQIRMPRYANSPQGSQQQQSVVSNEQEFVMPSLHEDQADSSFYRVDDETSSPRSKGRSGGSRKAQALSPANHLTRRRVVQSPGARATAQRATDRLLARNPGRADASPSQDVSAMEMLQTVLTRLAQVLLTVLMQGLEVLIGAVKLLKTPITYVVAAWLLLGFFVMLRNLVTGSIMNALSPICRVPGTSLLGLPFCDSPIPVEFQENQEAPVEFDKLMSVQDQFGEILEYSAHGAALSVNLHRAESSVRSLREITRWSDMPSRNELLFEFGEFVETAQKAGWDIARLQSHIGRVCDWMISTNKWTLRSLESIADTQTPTIQGPIAKFMSKMLSPFQPLAYTRSKLMDHYLTHMSLIEDQISALASESRSLHELLLVLEDRLDRIHSIAIRDGIQVQDNKEELLAQILTALGFNRKELRRFEKDLAILGKVELLRDMAAAHVSVTSSKLQSVQAELTELRERVRSVDMMREREIVPLAVHIEHLNDGVERLSFGRAEAKKLEAELIRDAKEGFGKERLIEGKN